MWEQISNGERPEAHDMVDSILSAFVDKVRESKRRHNEQAKLKREEMRAQRIAIMSQMVLSDPTTALYKDSLEKKIKEQ